MADKMQRRLDEEKEKFDKLNLKRDSIKNAYLHHKKNNENKHRKTLNEYDRFYKKFTEYFNENDSCTTITKLAVEDWLSKIKKLPFQKNIIHVYGKQLNNFLNFLFEYNYIPMFKISSTVMTRPKVKEKIIFSREDLDEIFDNLSTKNQNFKTLIYTAFYTGLRSSDILSIKAEDIDLEKQVMSYYSPKRKTHRRIAFHSELVPIFSSRIEELKTGPIVRFENTENVSKAFVRYMKKLNFDDKGYSLRTFRKTFQTLSSAYGMDQIVTDELVGYEHQKTSNKYYVHISLQRQLNELKKFRKPEKGDVY